MLLFLDDMTEYTGNSQFPTKKYQKLEDLAISLAIGNAKGDKHSTTQGNVNENHNDISLHAYQNGGKKRPMILTLDTDLGQLQFSYIADGIVKQYFSIYYS